MDMLFFISASDTKISDAALYAVIGFVIVLSVLALLIGIFYLTGFLFQTKALSKDKSSEKKSKKNNNTAVDKSEESGTEDEELFAVISAVISSIYDGESQETSKPDFVIRRISRKK